MTTAEIIKQMEKEFDEFVAEHKYSTVVDPALLTEYDVKSFIIKSIRTLLESFGEEITKLGEEYEDSEMPPDIFADMISLKVKEIVSSIGK